jgi:hypothetical protein
VRKQRKELGPKRAESSPVADLSAPRYSQLADVLFYRQFFVCIRRNRSISNLGTEIANHPVSGSILGRGFLNLDGRAFATRQIWPHPGAGVNRVGGSKLPAKCISAPAATAA